MNEIVKSLLEHERDLSLARADVHRQQIKDRQRDLDQATDALKLTMFVLGGIEDALAES
jgi:hypothetical protein